MQSCKSSWEVLLAALLSIVKRPACLKPDRLCYLFCMRSQARHHCNTLPIGELVPKQTYGHLYRGQPFSTAPLDEAMREEDEDVRAEQVGQALITVAIAILGIVFLKRAHLVTTI